MTGKPIEILLVEDNPGDVRLTQEVLKDFKVGNTMHVVRDGMEAMAFCTERGGMLMRIYQTSYCST